MKIFHRSVYLSSLLWLTFLIFSIFHFCYCFYFPLSALKIWKTNILPTNIKTAGSLLNSRKFNDFVWDKSVHSMEYNEECPKASFILGNADTKKTLNCAEKNWYKLSLTLMALAAINNDGRTQYSDLRLLILTHSAVHLPDSFPLCITYILI